MNKAGVSLNRDRLSAVEIACGFRDHCKQLETDGDGHSRIAFEAGVRYAEALHGIRSVPREAE